MSQITKNEELHAIKISQALQHFFDQNPGTHTLRSTDAYHILVTKNLVERDRHEGVKFREYLNKLKRANALYLIPQCHPEPGNNNKTNWFFRSKSKLTIKSKHINTVPPVPEVDEGKLEEIRKVVKTFPKINPEKLTDAERKTRETYPRAYEIWTEPEKKLLVEASEITKDTYLLAKVFGRQPSRVEIMLEELNG